MINRQDVDMLSRLSSPEWPIISLYLRVDKERIDEDYTIRLKNLLREAEESVDDRFTHEQQQALHADIERIRDFFRQEGHAFGRGVAVFASSQADIWHVYDIAKQIESQIAIGDQPVVGPLIRLLAASEPYCVCLISRDRARIFYGRRDQIEELLQTRDETVPGQHDQGGWAQARLERHTEEHVRVHFKHIADELFKLAEGRPYRHLVIGGPDEVVTAFRENLHPYVNERYVGTMRVLMEANIDEVAKESRARIDEWRDQETRRALQILENEALSNDQGVIGSVATIEAVQMGQVLTLVVDDTLARPGTRCTNCGSLQPESDASQSQCVYCGGTLEEIDDIIAAVITKVFQQGARVVYLDTPALRAEAGSFGGIGAILRYSLNSES